MPKPQEQIIWDYLTAKNIPWRESRASLKSRYGIRKCEWYGWGTVILGEETKIIDHMPRPLEFAIHAKYNDSLPPLEFTGRIWKESNCEQNIDFAVAHLKKVFGEPKNKSVSNTIAYGWDFGKAGIDLIVWPTKLNEFSSSAQTHQDPAVRYGCYININTGFRLELSVDEFASINNFDKFDLPAQASPPYSLGAELILDIVRNHPAEKKIPSFALGIDKSANNLIRIDENNICILPISAIVQLHLTRLTPARGGGSATLSATYELGGRTAHFYFLYHPLTDGLDDFAKNFASKLDRPLKIDTYYDE